MNGRRKVSFRPIVVEKPSPKGGGGRLVARLSLLGLLGAGAYGGYHGYCVYRIGEQERAFSVEAVDLQQALYKITDLKRPVRPADVRAAVAEFATRAGVSVRPENIRVTIEPLGPGSMKKLPSIAQSALGIAGQIPGHTLPPWVVGFEADLEARYGRVHERFTASRYTHLESAEP